MWSGKTWKAVHWVWTLRLKQEQKIKIILITLKPYHYFFHCVDIDCDVVKPTVNKAAGASAQIKMVEAKCRDITYWILQHSLSIIVDFGTYLSLWCHYTQNTRSSSAAPWAKNAGCFKGKPCCMVVWTLSFAKEHFLFETRTMVIQLFGAGYFAHIFWKVHLILWGKWLVMFLQVSEKHVSF